MSGRNPGVLGVWGPNGTRVIAAEAQWRWPLRWDRAAKAAGKRHRVFCASLADVFEGPKTMPPAAVPVINAARARLFGLIQDTPHLDWLLLTKRPENFEKVLRAALDTGLLRMSETKRGPKHWNVVDWLHGRSFPSNVWLGVSVENQAAADARIPHLLATPAAVRFLSCEPLLEGVNLRFGQSEGKPTEAEPFRERADLLHWCIVGGESGPGARPMQVEWARSLVRQCKAAAVPVFCKQLGARPMRNNGFPLGPHDAEEGAFPQCQACGGCDFGPCPNGELLCNGCDAPWGGLRDRKGGDPEEWPADLRVREFPGVCR